MKFWSDSFTNGEKIPEIYAFGKYHAGSHVELSHNKNPHFAWDELPEGTRSLALICHDKDVPSKPDDVNQEGKTVPADLPRVDFFHWVQVDIPISKSVIEKGEFSTEVTSKGKSGPDSVGGTRHGVNNYTQWFEGDKAMAGTYFGYDGPCPPWNDSILHHYIFTLYALDLERAPVKGTFTGPDVLEKISSHILEKKEWVGTYTLNPDVKS
jgi:Raf kinase inhibitor-like YbhB/YbcL family protein